MELEKITCAPLTSEAWVTATVYLLRNTMSLIPNVRTPDLKLTTHILLNSPSQSTGVEREREQELTPDPCK